MWRAALDLALYAIVFQSDAFERPWPPPGSDKDPNDLVWGKDLGLELVNSMKQCGIIMSQPTLTSDAGAWTFPVDYESFGYWVSAQWVPIGEPPVDHWAIQIWPRFSLWSSLSRNRHREREQACSRLASIVRETIDERCDCTMPLLLTADEFAQIY
jgi:hypothetical protein